MIIQGTDSSLVSFYLLIFFSPIHKNNQKFQSFTARNHIQFARMYVFATIYKENYLVIILIPIALYNVYKYLLQVDTKQVIFATIQRESLTEYLFKEIFVYITENTEINRIQYFMKHCGIWHLSTHTYVYIYTIHTYSCYSHAFQLTLFYSTSTSTNLISPHCCQFVLSSGIFLARESFKDL